jgi:FixJ family two-component response regulator
MLNQIGFSADITRNSDDFMEKLNASYEKGDHYNILIMDLTIPGDRGGADLIKEIRGKYTLIKAIVSSGYSDVPVMTNFREYGFDGVLKKPYITEELTSVIQKMYMN